MKKIFFISAVALSLVAVGTSTNNKGSNNDELISRTQADTIAKMGTSVKPLKNVEESHEDQNKIINLSNLPTKVNHHKTQHHKKVNKKKVNHKKVVNTTASQVSSINARAAQPKVGQVHTTNAHVGQVQTTQQQASNTTVVQTRSNVAQNSQRHSYTPQQNVRSYQVIQQHRQRVQYSQNSGSDAAQIAQAESGGSYTAVNPLTGAYGKYQLLPQYLHGDYSPANQERVFRQYCQQRYGSVNGALAFRQQHGWY